MEKAEKLLRIQRDRGCGLRQARRILALMDDDKPIPQAAFGPPRAGSADENAEAVEGYLNYRLTPEQAAGMIRKKNGETVSVRTFRRRVAEYVADGQGRGIESSAG